MKTAREIIAEASDEEIWRMDAPIPTRADTETFHQRRQQSVVVADAILAALTGAGYQIVPPGGIHGPTREAAAKALCSGCASGVMINEAGFHQHNSFTFPCHAEAVRSLEATHGE